MSSKYEHVHVDFFSYLLWWGNFIPLVLTHLYRAAIYDPIVCLSFLPRERREKWEGIAPYFIGNQVADIFDIDSYLGTFKNLCFVPEGSILNFSLRLL